MAQPSVVVAFTSQCGATETLAHAAAVGTVNARTLPRLRWLANDEEMPPGTCVETVRRLQREYVAPSEADILNSQGLIVVPSAGMTPASAPWVPFFALLDRLSAAGTLRGKVAAVIGPQDDTMVAAFCAALSVRGVVLLSSPPGDARAQGRAVGQAILASA